MKRRIVQKEKNDSLKECVKPLMEDANYDPGKNNMNVLTQCLELCYFSTNYILHCSKCPRLSCTYQDFFFLTHRRQTFSRVEIGQKRQQRCFSRVLRKYDIEIWRLFRRDKNCHDKTCPRILSQTIVLLLTGPFKARTERPRMENCLRVIKCGQRAHGKMWMIKCGWYYGS